MARERIERGNDAVPTPRQNSLSVAELRQLITLLNGSDLEEITIEQETAGLHLTLRKPEPASLALTGAILPYDGEGEPEAEAGSEPAEPKTVEVRASFVGIFRAAAKPGSKLAAGVGDVVREGQVVGAIEALNVLNEVEVPNSGRIEDILVSDGQPVEYGQTLLVLAPLGA